MPTNEQVAPTSYVFIVGLAFCLTFGSYFAVSNQLTSILGQQGFFILSIIQATFLIGTFFGQLVQDVLGDRKMFMLGACGFALFAFVLSLSIDNASAKMALYPVSMATGVFGSWMWCAQGTYISGLFSAAEQGGGFGKFNSIFSFNGIWAFTLLLILSESGVPLQSIMWIFFVGSVLACLSFSFVPEWPPRKLENHIEQATTATPPIKKKSLMQQITAVGKMFRERDMLLQAPLAFWAGNTEGMYWSTIAAQYNSTSLIAGCFLTQSIVALLASFTLGKLSDTSCGRYAVICICMMASIVTNIATGIGCGMDRSVPPLFNHSITNSTQTNEDNETTRTMFLIIGVIGFGISDFPAQAIMRAQYFSIWSHDSEKLESAMPHMLCCLMTGTLVAVLYGGFVDIWVSIGINTFLAALSIVCQFFLPLHVNRHGHTNPQETRKVLNVVRKPSDEKAVVLQL